MNGSPSQSRRFLRELSWTLSLALGLAGTLLLPHSVSAQEQELTWARIDFLRNRVQLVPQDQRGRRANISDVLSVGDSLRTARASRAELRFNDGSLARIGERATFRFTPNTRNFQLNNGTILLLIPPGRGRSTIQTPNAVTGIQGSALFVRYIPETDTTIVGALTNNPSGPMVLFNRDGTEQQALRANEIGVIQGDQITELYEFDGTLFWQSSGLAEGFNYLSDSASSGSSDQLDGVRQEIREAISSQDRLSGESVITNPETFAAPSTDVNDNIEIEDKDAPVLEFEDSPAQEYLESSAESVDEQDLDVGVNNNLTRSNPDSDEGAVETATETGALETGDEDNQESTVDATPPTDSTPTDSAPTEPMDEREAVGDEAVGDEAVGDEAVGDDIEADGFGDEQPDFDSQPDSQSEGQPDSSPDDSQLQPTQPVDVIQNSDPVTDDGDPTPTLPDSTSGIDDASDGVSSPPQDLETGVEDNGLGNVPGAPAPESPSAGEGVASPPEAVEIPAAPTVDTNPVNVPSGDISETVGPEVSAPEVPAPEVTTTVDTGADIDVGPDVSAGTIGDSMPEEVTVPTVEDALAQPGLQPVPAEVRKIEEIQVIHEMDMMHDPDEGVVETGVVEGGETVDPLFDPGVNTPSGSPTAPVTP